jgi:hypothetical protein
MVYKRFRVSALALAIAVAVILPLFAQVAPLEGPQGSYANNEFQLLARQYILRAEEAIVNGDFEASIEYSALAQENANLSDAYVQGIMERALAEKKIFRAETRLTWAQRNPIIITPPLEDDLVPAGTLREILDVSPYGDKAAIFVLAKEELALAHAAFNSEDFTTALEQATKALDALMWLSAAPEGLTPPDTRPWRIGDPGLPRYYVVQLWTDTGDCFSNIALKPFIYGTMWEWPRIYNANKEKVQVPGNPDLISPGIVLEIPARPGEKRSGTYNSARK